MDWSMRMAYEAYVDGLMVSRWDPAVTRLASCTLVFRTARP